MELEVFFPPAIQMNRTARRVLESSGRARSMSSALGVLIRAAQPKQRPPDGTEHSRHVWLRQGRPVGSGPSKTKSRPKGPGRSGFDLAQDKETHRCLRSKCRSDSSCCFHGYSRDVRSFFDTLPEPTVTSVPMYFLGRRLVQLHQVAERKQCPEMPSYHKG